MISFIVPAFNNPKRLRTCLSSLVDQTVECLEVIVADNTIDLETANENLELCRMDPRIKYEWTADRTIIGGPHARCLYTATEIGVGLATGEWLCFPNQDSAYPPIFAERMLAYTEQENLDLCYCDFILGGPNMDYRRISVEPHNCQIDKTCFIVKKSWFQGFACKESHYSCADGYFIESLVMRGIRHGALREVLVTHN